MSTDSLSALWDFADPAESERRFASLLTPNLSAAERIEVQTQIARAMGLQRNFEQGLALLNQLRPELEALPDDPGSRRAAVRWFLEHGRCLASAIHRDHPGRALRDYTTAFDRALAAGEDALAIDAAHMAAIVTEGHVCETWTQKGLSIAEVSNSTAARNWRGALLNNRGLNRHEQGRYLEALADFEAALAARREQGDPDRIFIAEWMIAWTYRALGRHHDALEMLARLAAQAADRGTPDPYVFDEQAENLRALGRPDEAKIAESQARVARAPS
jgi:tetratricopeptide (TPR) repeat protein